MATRINIFSKCHHKLISHMTKYFSGFFQNFYGTFIFFKNILEQLVFCGIIWWERKHTQISTQNDTFSCFPDQQMYNGELHNCWLVNSWMNIQFVIMITNAVSITTQVVMLRVRRMTYVWSMTTVVCYQLVRMMICVGSIPLVIILTNK